MLTLLATCYLTGQLLFTVPDGWKVTEVYSGGQRPFRDTLTILYCPPDCEEQRQKAYVKLARQMRVGDTVETPTGCTLRLEPQKE